MIFSAVLATLACVLLITSFELSEDSIPPRKPYVREILVPLLRISSVVLLICMVASIVWSV